MTVRKTVGTVGTLAQEAVSTAVTVVKHPIGSTALAAGLVKGAAGAGLGLLRGTSSTPESDTPPAEAPAESLAPEAEVSAPAAPTLVEDPRDDIPGPDLAQFEPPRPEDLPEPVVIVADDAAYTNGESGESFHNEPKATSRDSEHGAGPIDPEELDEYVEDITTPVEGGPQQ